ncbi:MAG: N-acetylmuramoyl-L-alanine amidase, partial [Bacteroidales bacterium]|nr:N-acetylmuramoyl-L-alanine amidase [Bacteroidales bacterium]
MTLIFSVSVCAEAENVKLSTIVIDAGHGGHDPGAISLDKKLREKTVTLDIAQKLGAKIKAAYPDVKVIYTRSKDVYVPLDERSDIANRNHADLFISIHINSVPKTSKAPSGCETFVMGMHKNGANMEVCKRENSVILLEDDYSTKYQGYDPNDPQSFIFFNLMQNANFEQSLAFADLCQKQLNKGPIKTNRGIKQGGLLVLWRTTMPSVLVELGFISNASDKATLASADKRDQLAGRLFTAFDQFKKQYEGGSEYQLPEITEESKQEGAEATNPEKGDEQPFAIQVFAISGKFSPADSKFKGEKDVRMF